MRNGSGVGSGTIVGGLSVGLWLVSIAARIVSSTIPTDWARASIAIVPHTKQRRSDLIVFLSFPNQVATCKATL
jgi:hypothetical protein